MTNPVPWHDCVFNHEFKCVLIKLHTLRPEIIAQPQQGMAGAVTSWVHFNRIRTDPFKLDTKGAQ